MRKRVERNRCEVVIAGVGRASDLSISVLILPFLFGPSLPTAPANVLLYLETPQDSCY
jgi:hypothetical protein